MTTKRKPKKKSAAKPKRKPVHNAHTEHVTQPTEVVEAPELVFQPGSFARRPRTFWQRVGDFFRGKP